METLNTIEEAVIFILSAELCSPLHKLRGAYGENAIAY